MATDFPVRRLDHPGREIDIDPLPLLKRRSVRRPQVVCWVDLGSRVTVDRSPA
jgi:hypothetical protein